MSSKDISQNAPWHRACKQAGMALWSDTRFALRQLRKSPGFTLIVIGTLALCIGVNTAVFSVLDAVLLRGAPYPEPDRLAVVVTARGSQKQIYRYMEHFGQPARLGFADTAFAIEDLGDAALGKNGPEITWL